MVNGRISPRSYRKYRLTRFFWKRILYNLNAAGMISEIDAVRLKNIGMDSAKIKVLGNAKYDALAALAAPALQEEIVPAGLTRGRMKDFLSRAARMRVKKKLSFMCIRNS
jgi:3-deoxy-D-manno-octulosonic-acid transferase